MDFTAAPIENNHVHAPANTTVEQSTASWEVGEFFQAARSSPHLLMTLQTAGCKWL
jgi:hypothetical protein